MTLLLLLLLLPLIKLFSHEVTKPAWYSRLGTRTTERATSYTNNTVTTNTLGIS